MYPNFLFVAQNLRNYSSCIELGPKWGQARAIEASCSKFKGCSVNLDAVSTPPPHFWLLLFQLLCSPHWQQQKLTLSGWTACSSRMLLVLGQSPGFLYTPTTPFHQAGIPATINQSGDSPWMSVNMFPSLPPFPATFLPHSLPCAFPLCNIDFLLIITKGLTKKLPRTRQKNRYLCS